MTSSDEDSTTSHIVTSTRIAAIMAIVAAILLFMFPSIPLLSTLPFLCLCLKGLHINTYTAILLYVLWGIYLLLLFFPLYYLIGHWCYFGLYSPLILMAKDIRKQPSFAFLAIQTIIWDTPLLLWMRVSHILSLRGMEPFYSEIIPYLVIGSLPLPSDAKFLHERNIRAVVNMCREYRGPEEFYKKYDIEQLHCPTADLCEPKLEYLQTAVAFIHRHVASQQGVFIHCKGGRGRAVAVGLCYLISIGYKPEDAMQLICEKRSVAAKEVLNTPTVRKFIATCK